MSADAVLYLVTGSGEWWPLERDLQILNFFKMAGNLSIIKALTLALCCLSSVLGEPPAWTYFNQPNVYSPGVDQRQAPWRPMQSQQQQQHQVHQYNTPGGATSFTSSVSSGGFHGGAAVPPVAPPPSQYYSTVSGLVAPQQQSFQVASRTPQVQQFQQPQAASSNVFRPDNTIPLAFGGEQSFYFSPKEKALYQVMKLMLSDGQYEQLSSMMKLRNGGVPSGQYGAPAAEYGPPPTTTTSTTTSTTTTTTPAPAPVVTALPPAVSFVPVRTVYRNRPKYNFTFTLRTFNGDDCEIESEPEPNEGRNPRLRPLPIRAKRGVMRCHKHGAPAGSPSRSTPVTIQELNPLAPFTPPAASSSGSGQQQQRITTPDGRQTSGSVSSPGFSTSSSSSSSSSSGERDSYLPPGLPSDSYNVAQQEPDSGYGAPKQDYGPPKQGYGPPKQAYGPPPADTLEFDESGTQNANSQQGSVAMGYEYSGSASGQI